MIQDFGEWLNSSNIEFIVGGIRYEQDSWFCIGFMEGAAYGTEDEFDKVSNLVTDLVGGDMEALDAMDELMRLGGQHCVFVSKSHLPSYAMSGVEMRFLAHFRSLGKSKLDTVNHPLN